MNITSMYEEYEDYSYCKECGARTHDNDMVDGSKWFPYKDKTWICIDCKTDFERLDQEIINEEKKTA